jgi:hypothetical protein
MFTSDQSVDITQLRIGTAIYLEGMACSLTFGSFSRYQTGALAPIMQWISLSAQRAMMPPQPPLAGADGTLFLPKFCASVAAACIC